MTNGKSGQASSTAFSPSESEAFPRFEEPESLPVRVATHIRDAILAGQLRPGTKLREIEISRTLGISRSPLREAFRILEPQGLVEVIPRRGAYVTQMNPEEAHEIAEVRSLLEGCGARLAAIRMDQDGINEMRRLLEEMRRASREGRYWDYQVESLKFHDAFMRGSNNPKLFALYEQTRKLMLRAQALLPTNHIVGPVESDREHGRILGSIEQRDPDGAEAAARQHVANVLSRTAGKSS